MTASIWTTFNKELLRFIQTKVNNPETAQDILQDVFVKIHQHANSIQHHEKLTSWIYQITRNTIIDYYRKKKIKTTTHEFDESLPTEVNNDTVDLTKCLTSFIEQLPEKYSDILSKTMDGSVSQKAYALENNLSYSAAKSRVQRARQALKASFIACCNPQTDAYGNILNSDHKNCNC